MRLARALRLCIAARRVRSARGSQGQLPRKTHYEHVDGMQLGGVLFFPESGVVFSHTHSCAFVCMRVHSYAFHCFLHAFSHEYIYISP